jgi:hypothetical protein
MSRIAAQVLPPLLLLPLFVMPVEVFTSLYWMAGAGAALISIMALARMARRWRAGEPPRDWIPALRPGLTVGIFTVAAIVGFRQGGDDSAAADAFARELARAARAACLRDAKCPQAPEGWNPKPGDRIIRAVSNRRVEYRRPEDGIFLITVRHPLETSLEIRGGVSKEIEEQSVIR